MRANERSERLSGPFTTRSSLTINAPLFSFEKKGELLRKPIFKSVGSKIGSHSTKKLDDKTRLSWNVSSYELKLCEEEQGRIHGNPVADGWAGAVMQKLPGIQKCDGRTDLPTYQPTDLPTDTARCRVACLRLKNKNKSGCM